MRSRCVVAASVLTAAVLALQFGCKQSGGSGGGTGPIVVGEYGAMTGDQSAFGHSTDDGIRLALDEINAAGGIKGRQVQIPPVEDDESTAAKAETAAERLVSQNPAVILGEVASSSSLAAAPVCQKNQIPMISPSSTNPKVTQVGDYIFRVCFIDSYQAAVAARFASESLHAKTAAIFYDASQAYSTGFRDWFKQAFIAKGGKIVQEASFTDDDKDFKAPLTLLQGAKADVILIPGYYTQVGTILKQARDMGITGPLLGGDGWSAQALFKYSGNKVGNAYFTDHMAVDDPSPTVQKFVTAFKAKFNRMPDSMAALGYDAARLAFQAMGRAKSLSGPDIRAAVAETKGFDGATGSITINSQRNADKSAVVIEVADGVFKFKQRIDHP